MQECAYGFITGLFVGVAFALAKAPIPCPPMLAGVCGIIGVWGGYQIVEVIR